MEIIIQYKITASSGKAELCMSFWKICPGMAEIFKLKYVTFHYQQSVVFGCVFSSDMCSEMELFLHHVVLYICKYFTKYCLIYFQI